MTKCKWCGEATTKRYHSFCSSKCQTESINFNRERRIKFRKEFIIEITQKPNKG